MRAADLLENPSAFEPSPVIVLGPGKAYPKAREYTFEPVLAERALDLLIERLVEPETRDMAFAVYHASETPAEAIVQEAETLPFLAECRVIAVRGAELYNAESKAGPMLAYLENPSPATVLILVAANLDRRMKFAKSCERSGGLIACPQLTENELTQWIRREAAGRGKRIDGGAVKEIIARAGARLASVENAFTLAAAYVGDAAGITETDVVAVCADVAEEVVWSLTDAIAQSDAAAALTALRSLLDMGKHPDELMGALNWMLKNAYVAAGPDAGNLPPFQRRKIQPLADKLGLAKVRDGLRLCTSTQFLMRNTGVDPDLAIELLVVKLAYPSKRARTA